MKYYDLTNKELLNATTQALNMMKRCVVKFVPGSVCILIITMQMARASTGLWKKQ